MIYRPKRTKKNLFPPVVLRCDAPGCMEREEFNYGVEASEISRWATRHGWAFTYKARGGFQNLCPICERLSKVPESHIKWAVAS